MIQLGGLNIVVYDLETKVPISKESGVGWTDYDKMGISVGCLYDFRDGDYKVYLEDNLDALAHRLNTADLIVAFNQIGFDNKLLRGNGHDLKPDSELNNYDMLIESRKAAGWRPGGRFPRGMKLDDHLAATFGEYFKKTDHGANAPLLYQAGKIGEVITYCLGDSRREMNVFKHTWKHGTYITAAHGRCDVVKHPSEFLKG